MSKPEILYEVKAQRGPTLRCKGWRQETILRMLENNMENAEKPEELVIYGGIGKCARNWESYHAIVKSLKELEDDETLVVQSGMPVAIFKTHKLAPTVVMATTNIMKADWETFYDLQDKNLTMFAQYTAAPWEYIGTQGVIQGTFETLSAIAIKKFNNDLTGKIYLTAGAGGMGGNQSWAMKMHGGVAIVVDADEKIIKRRMQKNYMDKIVYSLDEAIAMAKEASAKKEPLAIGVVGNAADLFEEAYKKGFMPDIISEMCPCHDPISYIPSGYTAEEAEEFRKRDRKGYLEAARETMKRQLRAMNAYFHKGVEVFEYGTSIRKECRDAGMPEEEAMTIPGFVAEYIRPLFCEGRGPFRWTCISGDPEDLRKTDDLALEICKGDPLVERWIKLARKHLPIEALPARICYMGFGQRKRFALAVNELIKKGELSGPVAFSRDNLDSGSIVNPTFESENMKDGGDLISDWPYLNALLNCAGMCDLIAIQANYSMGEAVHTGVTMIADGTDEATFRLEACMTTDSGIGVVRHAQAGYEIARDVANGKGKLTNESIKIPLWWEPADKVTFGPDDLKFAESTCE
ncbi:urocanate hydratase [Crassaminicella thermophila]|uniref:N(tele)-methylurocanate hydratase n=1 Tax=Crassaminicella thermophila TaxID=2599308 RepID=NTMUC_CRATE|nr:urocanate hydratase [Crassaminicella thermophila]QEK11066.1 urocanate hydratase [Crassaminicella thermophila]